MAENSLVFNKQLRFLHSNLVDLMNSLPNSALHIRINLIKLEGFLNALPLAYNDMDNEQHLVHVLINEFNNHDQSYPADFKYPSDSFDKCLYSYMNFVRDFKITVETMLLDYKAGVLC